MIWNIIIYNIFILCIIWSICEYHVCDAFHYNSYTKARSIARPAFNSLYATTSTSSSSPEQNIKSKEFLQDCEALHSARFVVVGNGAILESPGTVYAVYISSSLPYCGFNLIGVYRFVLKSSLYGHFQRSSCHCLE